MDLTTLIAGAGFVVAAVTLIFQWLSHRRERKTDVRVNVRHSFTVTQSLENFDDSGKPLYVELAYETEIEVVNRGAEQSVAKIGFLDAQGKPIFRYEGATPQPDRPLARNARIVDRQHAPAQLLRGETVRGYATLASGQRFVSAPQHVDHEVLAQVEHINAQRRPINH